MKTIYLDNSATTKTDEEVIKAMLPYLSENYGNPSSIYRLGRENRKAVEDAREKVAKALNCESNEIYLQQEEAKAIIQQLEELLMDTKTKEIILLLPK